ncbi:MAG TPA: hypothetical protein VMZ51_04415 [Acidimicrobiales bacterium]|nr:hypothetical protein [Acidimicrobiales bacterium]
MRAVRDIRHLQVEAVADDHVDDVIGVRSAALQGLDHPDGEGAGAGGGRFDGDRGETPVPRPDTPRDPRPLFVFGILSNVGQRADSASVRTRRRWRYAVSGEAMRTGT